LFLLQGTFDPIDETTTLAEVTTEEQENRPTTNETSPAIRSITDSAAESVIEDPVAEAEDEEDEEGVAPRTRAFTEDDLDEEEYNEGDL